ncbi:MAG: sulfur oxidation c-type cytochrome SoxA [Gammaproteobacteria bacterium]|nr:sulfur oxidation c-type cytochrome SoxA [Gammaproteobacteria bacterium]
MSVFNKSLIQKSIGIGVLAGALVFTASVIAGVADQDIKAFQSSIQKKFPAVEFAEFANGAYAFDMDAREQWLEMEEFAPYEIALEEGEELFNTPFANGKSYADCFENGGIGVRQNYPYYDQEQNQVVTLELAINQCREKNGEALLGYKKGDIASISAYMAYTSRGNTFTQNVPDDPGAVAAYEKGKEYFYSRRGQLNFSCASCHIQSSGNMLRAELLSSALGHVTHWPVYRSKWGDMGTLHRRIAGCNEQVRAKPLAGQSETYRNLEYFMTVMSQGLNVNGPGSRK